MKFERAPIHFIMTFSLPLSSWWLLSIRVDFHCRVMFTCVRTCLSKIASSETQGADSGSERKSTRAEKKRRVGKIEAMNEGRA